MPEYFTQDAEFSNQAYINSSRSVYTHTDDATCRTADYAYFHGLYLDLILSTPSHREIHSCLRRETHQTTWPYQNVSI